MNEKIVDKVKKLLALSESPNVNEAAAAAAKARELLDKYNLTLADVKDYDANIISEVIHAGSRRAPLWLQDLAYTIGEAFDCAVLLSGPVMLMAGSQADLAIATHLYDYLRVKLSRNWVKHKNTLMSQTTFAMSDWNTFVAAASSRRAYRGSAIRYKRSYLFGNVMAVRKKLKEFMAQPERRMQYDGPCKDLVIVKTDAIAEYLRNNNIQDEQDRKVQVDKDGLAAGYRDGLRVNIHRPIKGAAEERGGW